jgi:hypothetical protein
MKYLIWISTGSVCGAALGFLGPFGLFLFFSWRDGDRASGIGTPLSLLTLLTVPAGALMGAYAGYYRATNGGWSGVWSASRDGRPKSGEKAAIPRKSLRGFHDELAAMSDEEARRTKREHLMRLWSEYGSMTLNYWLVGVLTLLGLLFRPLLIVPVLVTVRFFWAKHALKQHIQDVENVRPDLTIA